MTPDLNDNDFKRLASFPEQNPNPVIELLCNGDVSYSNPAAKRYFPDLAELKIEHPIFSNIKQVIADRAIDKLSGYKVQIKVGELIFEQKFFYMEELMIIRLYSSDITHQKKTEDRLHQLSLFPIQNPNPVLEADMLIKKFTFKNPAADNLLLKLSEEEVLDLLFFEILERISDKKDFTCETLIDGRHYEQKVFFIQDTNLVRIYLHDLTDRKKNEKNLARLASFPEQNPNPIVEMDLTGNITYINIACREKFPDITDLKFGHPLLLSFKEVFLKIISGEILDSAEEIKVAKKYYIQRTRLMPEMGLIRVFNTDITSQKEVEELIREKNKDITDSINYAQRIQRSILPTEKDLKEILDDHFVLYRPKDIVSGDFYWAHSVTAHDNDRQKYKLIAAADCTGHGVPGALMSIVGSTLLNQTIKNPDINSPAQALDFLNLELPKNLKAQTPGEEIRDGMDITMVAITQEKLKMHFAGANNPIYIVRKKQLIELKGDKQPISGSASDVKKNFTNHTMDLEKGDLVYLFTDGFADQFGGPKGKKFKYKQLQDKLVEFSDLEMGEQKEELIKIFENWKGDLEQVDDVLLIGVKI